MDYLGEVIALSIDALVLSVCIKHYFRNKYAIHMIKDAPYLDIDSDLQELISKHPEKRLPYVTVRGIVKPLGSPIYSINNPNVVGVVQKLSIKEHVIQRSSAGFWSENERTIQEVYNAMPFLLESNGVQIEIADALAADIIDLDVISDHFEPASPSMMDHIWGFFSGVRQRGLQNTEEMLRAGTLLTGIGELKSTYSGRTLRLQPSSDGSAPFYLTTMPITSLVRKLDERKRSFRWLCILFGAVGIIISGLIARRYWAERKRKLIEENARRNLEATRRDRRSRVRQADLPENQCCVVCRENPREIIILPCGHVCLCEDCAADITDVCPVCRAIIDDKNAAYIP